MRTLLPAIPWTLAALVLASAPALGQAKWGEYNLDIELGHPTPETYDSFGHDVDVSGDLAVVTAWGDDDQATDAGAAFVLGRDHGGPGSWGQLHKLIPADAGVDDKFGQACAIDGNLVVVSSLQAPGPLSHGAVYYFDAATGLETHKLAIADANVFDFGKALDTDGSHVIVGAQRHWSDPVVINVGVAYVFDTAGNLVQVLSPSDGYTQDFFGSAVAIDGDLCLVSAPSKFLGFGAVYVYSVSTGAELYKLTASDAAMMNLFGYDVAIEGTRAIIGSPGSSVYVNTDGAAFYFDLTTGTELARIDTEQTTGAGASFGTSVAIHGDYAFIGCPGPTDYVAQAAGRIYQIDLDHLYTMAWFVHPDPTPSGFPTRLGYAVATDGTTVLDGYGDAHGGVLGLATGSAHVLTRALIGLGVDNETPAGGETLTLHNRGGLVGGFCGSALVAVNGTPITPWIIPGSIGLFDAQGEWSFQAPMPAGLGGTVLTIQSGGLSKTGAFVLTNTRDLDVSF